MPVKTRVNRREEILARAVDLASEEGLERLTIGRLATEMDMTKAGVFGHFGSKEELQLATIDTAARRFVDEVVSPALAEPAGGPRLRALCDAYVFHLEREVYPGGCFWGSVTAEFDDRPGPVRDAIQMRFGAWLALLADQARTAGAADPEQLAFELFALVQGANSTHRMFDDRGAFARARAAVEARLPSA